MTNLTELEQEADREARHAHRELVERLEEENRELALQVIASQGQADDALGRVAELEKSVDHWKHIAANEAHENRIDGYHEGWNDAIRAAVSAAGRDTSAADRIRELLREGDEK